MRHLILRFDYDKLPLFEYQNCELVYLDHLQLPISDELKSLISRQIKVYESTFNSENPEKSDFPSQQAKQDFREVKATIVNKLIQELSGNFEIYTEQEKQMPLRVIVTADFGLSLIQEYCDDGGLGCLSPEELPISDDLKKLVNYWDDRFQSTYNDNYPPDSKFENKEEEQEFVKQLSIIRERLQKELPEGSVVTE